MSNFAVHLHSHSKYSSLDAKSTIEELIGKCKAYELKSICVTDHGVTYAHLPLYSKALEAGIKPILAVEGYQTSGSRFDTSLGKEERKRTYHLPLIAMNETGFYNLNKLMTLAYKEGFYYDPRIDDELLKEYNEGIIALSGCIGGHIPSLLAKGKFEEAKIRAIEMQKIFGDRFYLEIQRHDDVPGYNSGVMELFKNDNWKNIVLKEAKKDKAENELLQKMGETVYVDDYKQRLFNKIDDRRKELFDGELAICEGSYLIGRDLGIPLVCTNDSHYTEQSDATAQDVLFTSSQGAYLLDIDRYSFANDSFYYRSPQEMELLFDKYPEAIDNTKRISDMCNVEIKPITEAKGGSYLIPRFPDVPEGKTEHDVFMELVQSGWDERVQPRIDRGLIPEDEYRQRLQEEIDVVVKMGMSGYFLIIADILRNCRENGIPHGPGRGSSQNVLICYLLKIVKGDPLYFQLDGMDGNKHEYLNLPYTRFMNPDRVSLFDIDTDVSKKRRGEVVEYILDKYGRNKASTIGTIGYLAGKSSIKKVATALRVDFTKINSFTDMMSDDDTIADFIKKDSIKSLLDKDPELKLVVDLAQSIEGSCQFYGTHAAGVLLSPIELYNLCSVRYEDGLPVAQLTMADVELFAGLKVDVLGLRTCDLVCDTIDEIKGNKGETIDIDNIDLDDADTYKMINTNKVAGCFQIDTNVSKPYLIKNKPNKFIDIMNHISLVRPGPLEAIIRREDGTEETATEEFFLRKNGLSKVTYPHPLVGQVLNKTYGIPIYQEDIMNLAKVLAGFKGGEPDTLRKAMGKKQMSVMEKMKGKFISGCQQNNISEELALEIWGMMETFSSYGFPTGHALAYGVNSVQTCWLKAHYPTEFMCQMLSSMVANPDKFSQYLNECKSEGIKVLPPDIKVSLEDMRAYGDEIRLGFLSIKGVGKNAIDSILKYRNEKPVDNFIDFLLTTDLDKTSIESLAKVGAFESLGLTRKQIIEAIPAYQKARQSYKGKLSRLDKKLEKLAGETFASVDEYQAKISEVEAKKGEVLREYPATIESVFSNEVGEYSTSEIIGFEQELLGICLSRSPLDDVRPVLNRMVKDEIRNVLKSNHGDVAIIGGIATNVRVIDTKTGRKMAHITLEDDAGQIKVVAMPRQYSENIKAGRCYVVEGHYEIDEKWGNSFMASSIIYIDDNLLNSVKNAQEQNNSSDAKELIVFAESEIIVPTNYKSDKNGYRLVIVNVANDSEVKTNTWVKKEYEDYLWTQDGVYNVMIMEIKMAKKYIEKCRRIEAVKYDGTNLLEVLELLREHTVEVWDMKCVYENTPIDIGDYVFVDEDGDVDIWLGSDFEEAWEEIK